MEQNIILLGPKAVGKSSISTKLQEELKSQGLGDYEIFPLDLFFIYCRDKLQGKGRPTGEMLYLEKAQLSKSDPDYESQLESLEDDFYDSIDRYIELDKKYDFNSFRTIIGNYEQMFQKHSPEWRRFFNKSELLSKEGLLFYDQLVYLIVLKKCLEKADKPLIIDAGGNIGSIYHPTEDDLKSIDRCFYGVDIATFAQELFDQIPFKVYIEPCDGYEELDCADIHDEANKMYMADPNSYKTYANISVKPKSLYTKKFEKLDRTNPVTRIKNQKYLNIPELDKISKKIVEEIKAKLKIFD